jgi:hypothetical protein
MGIFSGFAWAYCDDFTALWLFFGCVWDDDAAFGFFIGGRWLDDNSVSDWFHTFEIIYCFGEINIKATKEDFADN